MKLIDRYLLREYLRPLFFCFSLFIMMHVILDLFDNLPDFLEADIPLGTAALYYLAVLGPILEYIAPASLLLAALYTLWHLTRNSELTAMRAVGFSIYRIMAPFLLVGLIASIAVTTLKETIAPSAAMWATALKKGDFKSVDESVYRGRAYYHNSTRRVTWEIEDFDVRNPARAEGVLIRKERPDGTRTLEIEVRKARWMDGEWWFFDGRIQEYTADGLGVTNTVGLGLLGTLMQELQTEPSEIVAEVKEWHFLTTLEMARYLEQRPGLPPKSRAGRRFDLHRRLAMPWACLIVTLFGIPAGAKSGRQSALGGIISALAFFFAFYALHQTGLFLGKAQIMAPVLAAWLSNIVFLTAGTIMLIRIE
ncbi:MAG: LptF/LptG family permease [Kiritimatiellia bacterium]